MLDDEGGFGGKDEKVSAIAKLFQSQLSVLADLKERSSQLEEHNNELRDKQALEDYKEKRCTNCKLMIVPKFNDENSCVYHPGRMKFFSCKGCGGDEYYLCCLMCSNCTPGCRKSKHFFS